MSRIKRSAVDGYLPPQEFLIIAPPSLPPYFRCVSIAWSSTRGFLSHTRSLGRKPSLKCNYNSKTWHDWQSAAALSRGQQ